jgi:hypothetical protein
VLAAVGAVKCPGVRSLAGPDDAHVIAARPIAIDGAIEPDAETDESSIASWCHRKHVVLRAHRRTFASSAVQTRHGKTTIGSA